MNTTRNLPRNTIVLVLAVLAALVTVPAGAAVSDVTRSLMADASGSRLGSVRLVEYPTYVLVRLELSGVAPGVYGLAIHEHGSCVARDFVTAGDHLGVGSNNHPGHSGDLLPVRVMADGTANMQYRVDGFRLAELLDADGSAIVMGSAPDNLAHIPARYQSSSSGAPGADAETLATGDTGVRLACGPVRTK